MAKWDPKKRDEMNKKRLYRRDPVLAAFHAGWEGACALHLNRGEIGSLEAYKGWCELVGHKSEDENG